MVIYLWFLRVRVFEGQQFHVIYADVIRPRKSPQELGGRDDADVEAVEVLELRLKTDSAVFVVVGEAIDQSYDPRLELIAGGVKTSPCPEVFWER